MSDHRDTLGRRFFRRDPVTLAKVLLGRVLTRVLDDGAVLSGRVVEVEAYLGIPDRAAHTFGGRKTPRNRSMWLDGGHAYVYFTYGMHHCMNVVSDREGTPTACLIRALEPLEGLDRMRRHRAGPRPMDRLRDTDLCSGPAKLAQALAIDRSLDGIDLVSDGRLFLHRGRAVGADRVVAAPRIGVGYARAWAQKPLRFCVADSPHLSVRPEAISGKGTTIEFAG